MLKFAFIIDRPSRRLPSHFALQSNGRQDLVLLILVSIHTTKLLLLIIKHGHKGLPLWFPATDINLASRKWKSPEFLWGLSGPDPDWVGATFWSNTLLKSKKLRISSKLCGMFSIMVWVIVLRCALLIIGFALANSLPLPLTMMDDPLALAAPFCTNVLK